MGDEYGGDGCHLWGKNQGRRATAHGTPPADLPYCHPNFCFLRSWQTNSTLSKNFLFLPQRASRRQPSHQLCHPRGQPTCGSVSFRLPAEGGGRRPKGGPSSGRQGWNAVLCCAGPGWEGLTGPLRPVTWRATRVLGCLLQPLPTLSFCRCGHAQHFQRAPSCVEG